MNWKEIYGIFDGKLSELKITQSDTLTLTTAGWSNNAQTVSYAHDTAKRNGTLRFEREYHAASAKLSRLIYKEEVESFLRTRDCGCEKCL